MYKTFKHIPVHIEGYLVFPTLILMTIVQILAGFISNPTQRLFCAFVMGILFVILAYILYTELHMANISNINKFVELSLLDRAVLKNYVKDKFTDEGFIDWLSRINIVLSGRIIGCSDSECVHVSGKTLIIDDVTNLQLFKDATCVEHFEGCENFSTKFNYNTVIEDDGEQYLSVLITRNECNEVCIHAVPSLSVLYILYAYNEWSHVNMFLSYPLNH